MCNSARRPLRKARSWQSGHQPDTFPLGVLQEVSIDIKGDLKKLYGQKQFPVATARGKIDIEGKAKLCILDAGLLSHLYFGLNASAGHHQDQRSGRPDRNPYHPVPDHRCANRNLRCGLGCAVHRWHPAHQGRSGPAAGQYSVSGAGVYTFASADNVSAKSVLISYTYTVAGTGKTSPSPTSSWASRLRSRCSSTTTSARTASAFGCVTALSVR
jgi:hypothetical protein